MEPRTGSGLLYSFQFLAILKTESLFIFLARVKCPHFKTTAVPSHGCVSRSVSLRAQLIYAERKVWKDMPQTLVEGEEWDYRKLFTFYIAIELGYFPTSRYYSHNQPS